MLFPYFEVVVIVVVVIVEIGILNYCLYPHTVQFFIFFFRKALFINSADFFLLYKCIHVLKGAYKTKHRCCRIFSPKVIKYMYCQNGWNYKEYRYMLE